MNNSLLETLRDIFPIHVADKIYRYFIINIKKSITKEIDNNKHNFCKLLNIKKEPLAYWIIEYESIQLKKYNSNHYNIINYNKNINTILLNHHKYLKNWKLRNKKSKAII